MTRILVVDNRDSFVHNLVDYLRQLDAHVDVVDGTHRLAGDLHRAITQQPLQYDAVLLSPGPGTPEEAIVSRDLLATVDLPVLGVCLGHQAVGHVFGGNVIRAPELLHGKTSLVRHHNTG
ncbi:MAG: glutamine amidotransferase-related protein, partial [Actinomycetales bacterium]